MPIIYIYIFSEYVKLKCIDARLVMFVESRLVVYIYMYISLRCDSALWWPSGMKAYDNMNGYDGMKAHASVREHDSV